jgi:hypothetical protein
MPPIMGIFPYQKNNVFSKAKMRSITPHLLLDSGQINYNNNPQFMIKAEKARMNLAYQLVSSHSVSVSPPPIPASINTTAQKTKTKKTRESDYDYFEQPLVKDDSLTFCAWESTE